MKTPASRWHPQLLCALGGVCLASPTFAAAPVFDYITRLGFSDAAHTRSDDHQWSSLTATAAGGGYFGGESGHFVGTHVDGDIQAVNRTAWIANTAGQTRRVGLYDGAHVTSSGSHDSQVLWVNRAGQSAGYSVVYDDEDRPYDWRAWRATASGVTTAVGFETISGMNEAGTVIGRSGFGPWEAYLEDATGTHRLGEFPGAPYSGVAAINDAGYTIGYSENYPVSWGTWLRSPDGVYTKIGLTAPQYQSEDGDHNRASLLSNSGYVAGTAWLGDDGYFDSVAWRRAPNGATTEIGLYDADRLDAYPQYLNESGVIVGTTYMDSMWNGDGALLWFSLPDGSNNRFGLGDAGHRAALPLGLTESGYSFGNASRIGAGGGRDAFIAHQSGSTRLLALTDARHTRNDGFRESVAEGISETPVVWGHSTRFLGSGTERGQTAWFYHSPTRTMQPLEISVRSTDGYAWSKIHRVLKDGTVLGTYTRFFYNADTGERAFAWIPGRGVVKIDVNIDASLADEGWLYFIAAELGSAQNHVAGTGAVDLGDGTSTGVFLVQKQ